MKEKIQQVVEQALEALAFSEVEINSESVRIENTKDPSHGDFACNIAMVLAKKVKQNPRELAEKIISKLPESAIIAKVEIAGPGFINFFLTESAFQSIISDILKMKEEFGRSQYGQGKKIIIEFCSSNPTGPLHVGHGRGTAYGATVANLLEALGYVVHREYYVNDAGRQMHILTVSLWLRYLTLFDKAVQFPLAGYKGDYVVEIAKRLQKERGDSLCRDITHLYDDLPPNDNDHKDFFVDQLIARAKILLEEKSYQIVFDTGLKSILGDIKEDLAEFGVTYQAWFYESSLKEDIKKGIDLLSDKGYVYEKENALWFKATEFGDEKDRVLVRNDGRTTYFAADVGYHLNKYERSFDKIIDVFGADHHGYVPRINAFLTALGKEVERFEILLVQFAILYRGKTKVQMSTRAGEFVTLRELRKEVGNDAARFFYIMRKAEQHLDFDLELAKSKSNKNPVYYIQYAHARVCSVFRQAQEKQMQWEQAVGLAHLPLLTSSHEKTLMRILERYPQVIFNAANNYEPHLLAYYLQELANAFHAYYNAETFLLEDENLRNARLSLVASVKQVVINGLDLLGVSAPEKM